MSTTSLLNLQLLLKAVDEISEPVRRISGNLRGLEDQVKKTAKAGERLKDLGNNISKAGLGMVGAAGAAAAGLGMADLPAQALRTEHSLRALGNIAGLTGDQIKSVQASVLAMTIQTNQSQEALVGGLSTLLSRGMGLEEALTILPAIGKTATATQSSIEDLSRTLYAGVTNLKIPAKEATAYLDTLAQSGKDGAFELKDMARHFPALTARAQALRMAGREGSAQLGAALQVAMLGAGSQDEAANNFLNFISKLTSPETVQHFSKFGVSITDEIAKGWLSGDLLQHFAELTQRLTGGDAVKMSQLFGDMQAQGFLKPMLENLGEYKRIRDKALNASGVVDRDFQAMMTTTTEKWKKLRNQVAAIVLPKIGPWLDRISAFLDRISRDPKKVERLVNGIMAGLMVGGALVVLGQGIRLVGALTGALGSLSPVAQGAGRALSALVRGGATNLRYFGEYSKLMGGPLRGGLEMAKDSGGLLGRIAGRAQGFSFRGLAGKVAGGVRGFSIRGLLGGFNPANLIGIFKGIGAAIAGISWPVVAIVGVIAGAAMLIWKFWKPIANFFRGIGSGIMQALQPVLPPLKAAWQWFKKLLTPVEATSKSFNWGVKVGKAIGWVLSKLIGIIVAVVRVIVGMVKAWMAYLKMGWDLLKWWVTLPAQFFKKVQEFRKAGMSIPKAIWEGIKSMAQKPIQAIKEMIGKIKSILGFGKASATVAVDVAAATGAPQAAPKPASASAAQSDADPASGSSSSPSAEPVPESSKLPALEASMSSSGGSAEGGGGGGVHVTWSPTFHIGTAVQGVEDLVMNAIRAREHELTALIQRAAGRAAARSY